MRGRGSRGFAGAIAAAFLAVALVAPGSAAAFGPLTSFGSDGEGAGQLSAPSGIAVGPEGSFFVVDKGNRRVDVFSSGGEFLYAFGRGVRPGGGGVCDSGSGCQSGEGGGTAGALDRPEGIGVSSSGEVYVAEEGNDRVSVFSASGSFEFAFGYEVDPAGGSFCTAESGCQAGSNESGVPAQNGPAGALGQPTGVAINASGEVFVAEARNNRVSVFDAVGQFLYALGVEVNVEESEALTCTAASGCIEGNSFGISKPGGIATMPHGRLAISDSGNRRIDVFDEEGGFVFAFGHEVVAGGDICAQQFSYECMAGSGEGAGSLGMPAGLAVGPTGAIRVGDAELERVSQFNASGEFVRAFGAGVESGAEAFQVCTPLTACRAGLQGTVPGATSHPFGVAEACSGSIFVSESTTGLSRVERFGEAGSIAAACLPSSKQAPSTITVRTVPTNIFRLGRLERDRKHGTATLLVSVPGSGELDLGGRGVHPARRRPGAASTVELPVRLVGKSRRALFITGRRKVTARITFTPDGGTARTEPRKLTLVKHLKPKPRRR